MESPCFYVEASPSPNRGRNEEITTFASLYKLKALLGIGAFGVVLLVVNRHTREESALKIINKTRLSPEAKEFLRHESKILMEMNSSMVDRNTGHKSIVKFKQIFDTPIFTVIEMEYVKGGLLKKLFKRSEPLTEREASTVVKNILEGVNHIHSLDYIHRDLKPENIMLTSRGSLDVKIVDFGLSVKHKGGPISLNNQLDDKVGTLIYMAPEQASYKSYSKVTSN